MKNNQSYYLINIQDPKDITISLVLATIGRKEELRFFFESLHKQTHNNFEVIISDQNTDGEINSLVDLFSNKINIQYLKCEIGLSRARNMGLKRAKGEIIAFPDDDCWYQPDLLERVADLFFYHPEWDGVCGIAKSGIGNVSRWKWDKNPGRIDRNNIWQRCRSITIFLKTNVIKDVGEFDVNLGLGSETKWISGEETDYILRAIEKGFNIQYYPEIVVNHPDHIPDFNRAEITKGRGYGLGMGKVMRKHHYPIRFVIIQFLSPLGSSIKAIFKFNLSRARYFLNVSIGRIFGWLF